MSLSIIVAHDKNLGIGYKNKIPWYIPNDFKWFKENTTGKIVVMGTNTYFSLPDKFRPLPNRENIVLCNQCEYFDQIRNDGSEIFTTLKQVYNYSINKDMFIIGGASLYEQFIDLVDYLYITKIEKEFECDTFFPSVDYSKFKISYFQQNLKTPEDFEYTFNIYEKIK